MVSTGTSIGIIAVCDGEGPAGWGAALRVRACLIGFPEERAGYVGFGLGGHGLTQQGRERGGQDEQAGECEQEDRGNGLDHAGWGVRCAC